jgi:hypothetical protein
LKVFGERGLDYERMVEDDASGNKEWDQYQ